ncbi:hypothetical protein Dda_3246 [Drechslerella dactyloides]|uniref:Uncharacterized protein n=1 Tax=Drechslerella dactyloides TaxID=74499 RepID=A0AAD6J0Z4_DREDA|nr:hypothetical protein Dda_3246 [Drechslerella dactyloides]
MRPAVRLFQAVKGTRRLPPFSPTGIAGLPTHHHPRPTLLNIYNSTLTKLAQLPEESAYRTATEAIIKHRKRVVEEQIPAGWDNYVKDLARRGLESPPKYDDGIETMDIDAAEVAAYLGDWPDQQVDDHEWVELRDLQRKKWEDARKRLWEEKNKKKLPEFEGMLEPDISAEQVETIETQLGTGLIEEVIVQAFEEYKLVDEMAKSKPWEPLVEQPVEGQWTYFERAK